MSFKFKDLFISYGRRESLGFVGRLHQRLKLAGYEAWFDKVNIPDGDDYAQRINHGIESAHNFVYVMAPRCMTSPYCLIELEYARLLGKRVIPVNQMVIFETPEQELSAGDQQVMVNFYKHHNLPNQNIRTTQDVLNRSHALIGRTDWLDAKEKLSDDDCQRLVEWAQPYENNWAKHDDLDYLKTFDFPVFGQCIDALDGVVERITAVLERQKEYVHRHTEILAHALMWQNNQKATHYLLVGKTRQAAEEWLLTEFLPPKQPPCRPSTLVCEFICEARKNAENLMTDVFICYEVNDKDIRNSVIQSLSRYAVTTWTHDRDIQKGADYGRAIEVGIENADNFFYFISPSSVTSDYCRKELEHALLYNKRVVPLLIAPTPVSDVPDKVRGLQYVDFTDNTCQADYDSDIDDILNILRQDQAYYEQHKVLLARALKWEAENCKPSFLLRGHNLENAQTWLRLNDKREQHPPLALHQELITASEAAKGQLGTEVFLSYSRKDGDFARQLNTALQEAGKTTWFDQESISTGVDFEKEIFKGIDGADNFVFVLSPDAVQSEYCEREVNYAAEHSKRFITILHRETDPASMPDALRVINWIDFQATAFDKSFPELVQAIELDREHAHQHTVLQQRASDWAENGRSGDFLLNMVACANAESWRDAALEENKQPAPTVLQQDFIQDSRKAITKANRRRNILLTLATSGMIVAMILGIFAFIQMDKAKKAQAEAEQQRQKLYKRVDFTNKEYAKELTEQKGWKIFRDPFLKQGGKKGPEMIWLPAGQFSMGDIQGEGDEDEKPVHQVSITRFAMGRYEVTVGEFRQFIEATGYQTEAEKGYGCRVASKHGLLESNARDANWRNPYFPIQDNQPVVCVSWSDALAYTQWLSTQTGQTYRLPSEAQWEYAARAGKETVFWWRNNIGKNWANCNGCSSEWDNKIAPIGSFMASPFGLYDTTGNVWEWVADPWHSRYKAAPSDGSVWEEGGNRCVRVIRGGAWNEKPQNMRVAYRYGRSFPEGSVDSRRVNLGFRVVRQLEPPQQQLLAEPTEAGVKLRCEREKHMEFTKDTAKVKAFEVAQQYINKVGVFRDRLTDGSEGPEMVWIPAGQFKMGDIQGGGARDEKPVHEVSITRFAMGRYEVTFEEYDRFAQATGRKKPSDENWGRGKRPVVYVSWDDATAYANWLSTQTGQSYRLPSEAEWEYAARAGTETQYWWDNQIGTNWANCGGCGSQWDGKLTALVGSFISNPFGLYDTVGNVWEWVADPYHSYDKAPSDGRVFEGGGDSNLRVLRGGAWNFRPWDVRAAIRFKFSRDVRYVIVGFRIARD
jgi:formylglycine-generating enzyme required for sulfatase activity